jgi:flagellar protein FliO/FliZ
MSLRRHLRALPALGLLAAHALHGAHAALPTVPTPVHEAQPSAVGASGLLQAGFGMAVVVGLIFLCAWAARRFGLQRLGGGHLVKVVSSASVGQRERVVVVEVGGQVAGAGRDAEPGQHAAHAAGAGPARGQPPQATRVRTP